MKGKLLLLLACQQNTQSTKGIGAKCVLNVDIICTMDNVSVLKNIIMWENELMTDKEAKLQEMKLILLNNLKKKVDNIDDKTEEKEAKVTDPLKNMKAIVKHYGTHNRLI